MNLDINVTSTCNLGCKYCSEGHNPEMPDLAKIENSKTDVGTQELLEFISKIHQKNPEEKIQISFWGGEPMINMRYCLELMEYYQKDKRISFFFYTNGTYIKKYTAELTSIYNLLGDRLEIQISYDGEPINNIERLTKKDFSTVDMVLDGWKILGEIGIKRQMKSTITPRTFHLIYDAYIDMINIPGNQNYFPTPDTHSDYNTENEDKYLEDLKNGLAKIAKHIYENKLPVNSFGWFQNSKALCSAGIDYFSIDLDGELSPCHGTMYEEHGDHELGNIREESIENKLEEISSTYKELINHMNDDCAGCNSLFCMKCPAGSYNLESTKKIASKKSMSTYDAKWTTKNINMCKIFKLNDLVHKSLLVALKQQPIPAEKKSCELR